MPRNLLNGKHTPQNIALYAFALGIACGGGIAVAVAPWTPAAARLWWSFGAFVGAVALFHFLEYLCTAMHNPSTCSLESFLLDHSPAYKMAMVLAVSEFALEALLLPQAKSGWLGVRMAGLALVVAGQLTRTAAMHTAGSNFSHQIASERQATHELVTSGVYAVLRHPSYTGFYYWSLGTQLLLANPVGALLYFVLLARFFGARIAHEEATLLEFFGEKYAEYRARTYTLMPLAGTRPRRAD